MKKVITRPQASDMGTGYGYFEFQRPTTLSEFLSEFSATSKTWGTITIEFKDGEILRKFDYDTWNNNQCFYHLSWELNKEIDKATFDYCFMSEDIFIKLL